MPNPTSNLTTEAAVLVVKGFHGLATSRSAVRLDFRDYVGGGSREDALAAYRQDRNRIRRHTAEFQKEFFALQCAVFLKATQSGFAHGSQDYDSAHSAIFAEALIHASKGERFEYVGGERGYNAYGKSWQYCVGQYQPTEIRIEAARVARSATRYLERLLKI